MAKIDFALDFAIKNEWYVFPVREKPGTPYLDKFGKWITPKPKFPYTTNGILDASKDAEQINKWWKFNPNAAIGINTGMSGLFVIDIDRHNPDIDSFGNYKNLGIDDSQALHSMTAGGGLHIVFRGAGPSTKNPSVGIDTRSLGGYIVAPPSIFYNDGETREYKFLDDWFEKSPREITQEEIDRIIPPVKNKKPVGDKSEYGIEDLLKLKDVLLAETNPIRSDSYDDWIKCMYILKGTFGDDAFDLWDKWSQLSSKYNADDCRRIWDLGKPNGSSSPRTLYWWRKIDNQKGK